MNILILSCGTRNKLIEFFKHKKSGFDKVIVTDCSEYAPALYSADQYYLVPPMKDPGYLAYILDICRKENIRAVLPLQEDELTLLAKNRPVFLAENIFPFVSSLEAVEICRDKILFFNHLQQHGLPTLNTYDTLSSFGADYEKGLVSYPVFVKPIRGCGSISVHKAADWESLQFLFTHSEVGMLIQEYASGEEYGADIYVDPISHAVASVFVKKKLRMRAGETEKSISIVDAALFALIEKTIATLDLIGPLDMDIFKVGEHYYISEINPRFGGGYPHAYACGVDFPSMIGQTTAGKENPPHIGNYRQGICYLKYSEGIVVEKEL